MTELEAWLRQVEADFTAAGRVLREGEPETYCQAIAKYQQVVEKSLNVMDAAMREHGTFTVRVRAEHYPLKMINRMIRLPREGNNEIASRLTKILYRWWADIYDLCSLAPKLPPKGEQYRINTEYPFQQADGEWTAPAADSSFRWNQVQRFGNVARALRAEARRIADWVQLGTS